MNDSLMKWLERNINAILIFSMIAMFFLPWLLTLPAICPWLDLSNGGPVGDVIGGITTPIIGVVSIVLLVLTLKNQKDADYHSQLENRIFQLLKLHIDNVYSMHSVTNDGELNGQEVMQFVSQQISSCVKEIRPFIEKTSDAELFSKQFVPVFDELHLQVEKKQFAILDIAFCVVYIGVGKDTIEQLRIVLSNRYNPNLVKTIIDLERLKSSLSAEKTREQWDKWNRLSVEKKEHYLPLFDTPYEKMNQEDAEKIKESYNLLHKVSAFRKFYYGHQFRLSHYYRHMYMVIEYITDEEKLTNKQKYNYVKILRSQLSTTEQVLLMANSVSQLGGDWELFRTDEKKYITTYNLIKNIPQSSVFGIDYRKIYPNIEYEIR